MGLINSVENVSRQLASSQNQKITQSKLKEKYTRSITSCTFSILDSLADRYNNYDKLYHDRINYMDRIIKLVYDDGLEILDEGFTVQHFQDFNIEYDVNMSFYSNFEKWVKFRKRDDKILENEEIEESTGQIKKNNDPIDWLFIPKIIIALMMFYLLIIEICYLLK